MSLVKYRLKEVAADFGVAPKVISEIIGKYGEKPKSNTQALTTVELILVFDHLTFHNQIGSIAEVFAVAPKEQPKKEEPKAEAPKTEKSAEHKEAPKQPQQSKPQTAAPAPKQEAAP